MKKIGYMRVSTREQCPDRQIDALTRLCDEVHIERVSAIGPKRPVYQRVMRSLRAGDTLVILDLDRAYRSTVDAITEMEKLKARGAFLQIVNLHLDTSTPGGLLVYTVVAACAAFERQMLSQRTKEGLAAARERGKVLGRPRKLNAAQIEQARQRLTQPDESLASVAAHYGVAPWTITRSLRRQIGQGASSAT
jgi:DNA invertase Pin-like site-specific DNA recombinase